MVTHHRSRRRRRHPQKPPGSPPGTLTADPHAPTLSMQLFGYGKGELLEKPLADLRELKELRARYPVLWLNVDGLGDIPLLETLGEEFGLHRLALEDVTNLRQRPKVDVYEDHLFITARMFLPETTEESEQISLFLGKGFVLSFQERAGDVFDPVRQRVREQRPRMREGGADYLAYALLDAIVDAFFPRLEAHGDRLEELETGIMERADQELLEELHALKRELLGMRRILWSLREAVAALLRGDTPIIAHTTQVYLRDCHDHTIQLLELLESYRDIASGLMEVYLSTVSNRMNEVMKVLTIIATVFIPLGFVAGLYGMNFDPDRSPWNMPELRWYWGYPFALGLMAIVAALMVGYFIRQGWIGGGGRRRRRLRRERDRGEQS